MTRPRAAVSVRGASKSFGDVVAVRDLTFEVRTGEVLALLGRNGAGKTTTMRMLTGIHTPDRGSVQVLGGSPTASALRDRIGYLPEERGLYGAMRVLPLVLFFAELKGKRAREALPYVERLLDRLELTGKRDELVQALSKGNQQKVQLLAALAHDPELVIVDEPLSGLDPVSARLVRGLFAELKSRGRAIVLSTHVMALAESLADELVLIDRGSVVTRGGVDEVRRSHRPGQVLRLQFEGDGAFLASLRGVEHAQIGPGSAELSLSEGCDAQAVLAQALRSLIIVRSEVGAPSLETVFVERVGMS